MTRILLALMLLVASTPALAVERRYTVTDFDRIRIEGPFKVSLATGKPGSAIASGSAAAIDQVSIDVQNRTLRIRANRSAWGGYPGENAGAVTIAISTHDLIGAVVAGSGSLAIDKARALRFDIGLSGSGRITLGSVEADIVSLGLIGSGKILIGGKAKNFRATVQGNGDLDAGALSVTDADIVSDTSGLIQLAVTGTAKIEAIGPGDVEITGKPACTVKVRGSGRVTCGDAPR